MNPDWQAFLDSKGAQWAEGRVLHYGDQSAEARATLQADIVCDLSHFGVIAVSGADAQSFLQGQFSNDIRSVDATHHQLSAYCSPKGRILASFRVFMRDDAFYLRLPAALLEPTLKRLRMFVLRAKVTLEDASARLMRIGISGDQAAEALRKAVGALPDEQDGALTQQGITLLSAPGTAARFEVYGEAAALRDLWLKIAGVARPVGATAWNLLDILAGVPDIQSQNVDAFVPQMVNLQLVNGVNFKKGCYPGQEVVARMQYLGKLKRRMYQARVDTNEIPQPGTELFAPSTESGQGTGRVVAAEAHPDGGCALLAVVQISDVEAGDVRLGDATGPVLRFEDLPYPLDAAG